MDKKRDRIVPQQCLKAGNNYLRTNCNKKDNNLKIMFLGTSQNLVVRKSKHCILQRMSFVGQKIVSHGEKQNKNLSTNQRESEQPNKDPGNGQVQN